MGKGEKSCYTRVRMTEHGGRLPPVRRARGYRLYDERGNRYLDLYQLAGHALLGHRAFRLTTVLKDTISRGTVFDLPSGYGVRLEKALGRMFPAFRHVRIASSLERAVSLAARRLGRPMTAEEVVDPVRSGAVGGPVCLWRPYAPAGMDPAAGGAPGVRALIPVLPFRMAGAPAAVCFRDPPAGEEAPAPPISPVVLAGTLRAVADLARYRPAPWFREKLLAGCPGWLQRGIYLVPAFAPELYAGVHASFLEAGVLLSPAFEVPSILPAEASPGELKLMLRLLRAYPGG